MVYRWTVTRYSNVPQRLGSSPLQLSSTLMSMEYVIEMTIACSSQSPLLDTCALQRRFDQTESLFVLALWKIYDEFRQSGRAGVVILSLDDFFAKLKSYLPNLLQTPPKSGTYNRVLAALQRRNLVRYSWNETSPGQSELQVLPTILYVIPFAGLEAWVVQMDKFVEADAADKTENPISDELQQP